MTENKQVISNQLELQLLKHTCKDNCLRNYDQTDVYVTTWYFSLLVWSHYCQLQFNCAAQMEYRLAWHKVHKRDTPVEGSSAAPNTS